MEKNVILLQFDSNIRKFYTSLQNYDKLYGFGEPKRKFVYIEPEEALYLLEKGKVVIEYNSDKIDSFTKFVEYFVNDFSIKVFLVIKDLRDRGYYVDITEEKNVIVHAKGERNNPIYFCIPIFEHEEIKWKDIIRYLKHAKEMGTKLLLAFIDDEFDIVYYELSRIRI